MSEQLVQISGRVTDFAGTALAGATVDLKDRSFSNLYSTLSGPEGEYRLQVEPGVYASLIIVRDYGVRYLEYWAWNVAAHQDLTINARIDGLEIYGLNAFRVQGAHPAVTLYFRPMSLARYQQAQAGGVLNRPGLLDISPSLSPADVSAAINDVPVEILALNRVREYCGQQQMHAYLAQISLPEVISDQRHNRVDLVLTDAQTGERGEASLFWLPAQVVGT